MAVVVLRGYQSISTFHHKSRRWKQTWTRVLSHVLHVLESVSCFLMKAISENHEVDFVSDWCRSVCVYLKTTLTSTSAFIHKQKDQCSELHGHFNRNDAENVDLSIKVSLFSCVFFALGFSALSLDLKHWHSAGPKWQQPVMMRSRGVNWLFGGPSRLLVPTRDEAPSLPGSCSRQRSSHRSCEGQEGEGSAGKC